jgi:uncharacterized protein (DUF2062 family)
MLRKRLQRWIPSAESVRTNRSLRWLGPLLERPWLWQLSRRRVAAGAAIGVFFGFLTPIAQILFAAGAAIALRANLPVAAVSTLVTNPLTFAPVYVAAYYTGSALLGQNANPEAAAALAEGFDIGGLMSRAAEIGKPWFVGLIVFAVGGAALTWLAVQAAWIGAVRWQRWRGRRRSTLRRQGLR